MIAAMKDSNRAVEEEAARMLKIGHELKPDVHAKIVAREMETCADGAGALLVVENSNRALKGAAKKRNEEGASTKLEMAKQMLEMKPAFATEADWENGHGEVIQEAMGDTEAHCGGQGGVAGESEESEVGEGKRWKRCSQRNLQQGRKVAEERWAWSKGKRCRKEGSVCTHQGQGEVLAGEGKKPVPPCRQDRPCGRVPGAM